MSGKRRILLLALAASLVAMAFVLGWYFGRGEHAPDAPLEQHDLKPVKSQEGDIKYWTCTMHPSVKMKDPGKCPICVMDLVPVKKGPAKEENPEELLPSPAPRESLFTVDPRRQQLIGVRTDPVTVRVLDHTLSTIGVVELDERRIVHVHTKFSGWISKVYVDYTWQRVRKGEPLFSIYSPELVATQEEYLLALKARSILGGHPLQEVAGSGEFLLAAARRRLHLWDVTEDQIEALRRDGEVRKDLVVYSPADGHVTDRNAFENMRVEPGTRIYTLADHSRVWVHVDVYENDIPLVRLGQRATMTVEGIPGHEFSGKVTYILPHLAQETRTLKVRLEFANPDLKLKPAMYARVKLHVPGRKVVVVPESAVLRTGERDIVFVDHGQGRMEVRRVQLGQRAEDSYEVLKGLKVGEEIVVAGNFLIDAESKVQGVIPSWEGGPEGD